MIAGWSEVTLGDVLTKSDNWIDLQPDERYHQVTVRLWGKGVAQRAEVSGAEIAAGRQLAVHAGQFILSRIDARNGAFGLVPDSLDGAVVSNDFPTFAVNRQRVFPAYLGWLSRTSNFVDLCKAASEGTTNRVRLKEDRFLATVIELPPLDEQQRIVARIEELATKIEEARGLRQQAQDEAGVLLRAGMRNAFRPQHDTPLVPLEAVCVAIIDNLHSNPVYADSGVPCVRSPDVGWGDLHLETALKTSEAEYVRRTVRGEPAVDDIVLVREGGGTGKAAIVESGQRFSLGQRVMMLRPDRSEVLPRYLLYQLLSPAIFEDQILQRTKGSASPHLNIGALKQFAFLLPPLCQQEYVVGYLNDVRKKLRTLKQLQAETAAELDALLPSVLDRAFSGEL